MRLLLQDETGYEFTEEVSFITFMRLLIVLLVILSKTGISNENVSVMLTF